MRLVFVTHNDNSQKFLFQSDIALKNGDYIQVSTMHGPSFGRVVGGTFNVSDDDLNNFVSAIGAYLPLKQVTGYFVSIHVPF